MSPSVFEVDVDTTRKDPEVLQDSKESGRVNWPRQDKRVLCTEEKRHAWVCCTWEGQTVEQTLVC